MRKKVIFGAIGILILGVAFIFYSYGWFLGKQERVLTGTARPEFPYNDYTIDEMNKMYPQYVENNAPTIQTPEQTYDKFRAALRKGDLDEAVKCCFREGEQMKWRDGLEEIKNEGLLDDMIKDLGEIEKETMNDWEANYSYATIKDGEKIGHIVSFIKTSQGIWLIESL